MEVADGIHDFRGYVSQVVDPSTTLPSRERGISFSTIIFKITLLKKTFVWNLV